MKKHKTLKVRVKDKHARYLNQMARSVNFVWNYINELSSRSIRERGVFLSAYDIHPYTSGASKDLGIPARTVQEIARFYVISRKDCRKNKLCWRRNASPRRSLGWIPFTSGLTQHKDGMIRFYGSNIFVWDSYGLDQFTFRSGSFNEDARGRWYFNVVVDAPENSTDGDDAIGIDLGLKDIATCSDGEKLGSARFYRDMEDKLATAQRARNKKRMRNIHAKIKNRRKDAQHKFSRKLVDRCSQIVVGDVSSNKLAKTRMAKSVMDAGWGQLKSMLEYKCAHAGVDFKVVSEAYTSRTCSSCGSLSGPQGVNGLRVRDWECVECGVLHDRDVNAAQNILCLGAGHRPPDEGIAA